MTSSVPEPTLVLYKSKQCRHCQNLTNIWDSVTASLKSVYQKLRIHVVTANDNSGKFDENTSPKDIARYGRWYPIIFLVPGRVWDLAMNNLGPNPKNHIEIKDGVQIMNGKWDNGNLSYVQQYDIRQSGDFAKWLKEALDNEDFKRVHNATSNISSGNSGVIVPIQQHQTVQSTQPIISSITKPKNTTTSYTSAGSERYISMEPSDICSMRIISRPK